MKRLVQGIVLRHIDLPGKRSIGQLLLRNGKTISVGCRLGVKKTENLALRLLGYCLELELAEKKFPGKSDVVTPQSVRICWAHHSIEKNYQAFLLMSVFLELMQRISVQENLYQEHMESIDQIGIFRTLSNGMYYLEKSIADNTFKSNQQLPLFLTKLIFEMGISPDSYHCCFCHNIFVKNQQVIIIIDRGGVSCLDCLAAEKLGKLMAGENIFSIISKLSYKDFIQAPSLSSLNVEHLMRYLAHHLNFSINSLKAWPLLMRNYEL